MFSLFSLSPFGREMRSGGGKRRLRCQPRLEVLEDRNLLAFWTTVAPLLTARGNLASALGSDGRIYAIGGLDSTFTDVSTVEAYNTAGNFWTTVAPLHSPREQLAAATGYDGRTYALGSKSTTSAPIRTGNPLASNSVIGRTPLTPARNEA